VNPHPLARTFLKIAAIVLLVAFWSLVLGRDRSGAGPHGNVSDVAGLRPCMPLGKVRAILSAWGTPFEVEPASAIERPDGRPVPFATIRLRPGPSPFGPLSGGVLRFLGGGLFWVDLDVEAPILWARDDRYLGPALRRTFGTAFWRLEGLPGFAVLTGDWTRHHLTLAFHEAVREAGLASAEEIDRARKAFEGETLDALEGLEEPEDPGELDAPGDRER